MDNAKRFADLARAAVADGFTAFKSMAVPSTMPIEGLKPVKAAEACIAADQMQLYKLLCRQVAQKMGMTASRMIRVA